jgi:hypothetical protein
MVFLTASAQVFQIAKTGTVNPTSTVLTADVKNLAATPTLTVVSGTITPAPALVNGSVTIGNADLITDSATLRLSVFQDGITYTDQITLVKVREGIDSLTGLLTNESHAVAADYLGNALGYVGAGGSFKVFQGINDITSLCTYAIPVDGNPSALTASIGANTGLYAVTGGYPTNTDLTTLTLRATFGVVSIDKVFTIAKSKVGQAGQRGSRTFYAALTGTDNVYSDTFATTIASTDGGPIKNDTVTQYNTSMGFSQTKFYQVIGTVGSWAIVNAVVDGNLLVSGTVAASHIQSNTLNSDNVLTRGLTVRDLSGNIILSSGIPLDYSKVGGTTKPADNATVGATFGSNISGQITAANASTFIANAAIVNAQIGTLDAQKINTGFLSADRIQASTITADKINGTNLAVVNGTFSGSLSAATGTFTGALSAASGTFTGALSGSTGTFSGSLTVDAINAVNTVNIAGAAITESYLATGTSRVTSENLTATLCTLSFVVPSGQTWQITTTGNSTISANAYSNSTGGSTASSTLQVRYDGVTVDSAQILASASGGTAQERATSAYAQYTASYTAGSSVSVALVYVAGITGYTAETPVSAAVGSSKLMVLISKK